MDGGESGAEDPGRSPWTTGPLIPQCPSPVTCATVLAPKQSDVCRVARPGRDTHACVQHVRTPAKKAGLGFKKSRSACLVKPATPPAAPLFARRHKKEGRRPAVSTAALHRLRDLGLELDAITQQHRNIAARTCTRAPCRC